MTLMLGRKKNMMMKRKQMMRRDKMRVCSLCFFLRRR